MIQLINSNNFFEIFLDYNSGIEILDWYKKYTEVGLEGPQIVKKLIKALDHVKVRSTIFSLDTADMYILTKWFNSVVSQVRETSKPPSLQTVADLIQPFAHPVGPIWQYTPQYRKKIDEINKIRSQERRKQLQEPIRHRVIEI